MTNSGIGMPGTGTGGEMVSLPDEASVPSTASRCLRVVAIDDHETIRRYVAAWVEKTQIARVVEVCSDAQSGLDACRRLGPDLVLCDVHMPYADGHEFQEMLLQDGLEIPVLFFSAHALDEAQDSDVLHKTATLAELHNAILRAIGELV
jgi:CheY-like chemotaxis protein